MRSESFIQLLNQFKDEQTAIKHFEKLRWNGNPVCPHCKKANPYVTTRGYKCSNSDCYKKFTVKIGTVFENSKIPLRAWFIAIYLCTAHKKGINSVQLAIDLGVTQKTAWYMLHRIREMLKQQAPEMLNKEKVIEMDETYIGGKEENRHYAKRRLEKGSQLAKDGTPYNKKKIVLGMIERNGQVILKHVPNVRIQTMYPFIEAKIPMGAKLMTDDLISFRKLRKRYTHQKVCHSQKVYVMGTVHTNSIENFWSIMKRSLYGMYHQVSEKHLERYLFEFAARFNARHHNEFDRINMFLQKTEGRLTYKNLIKSVVLINDEKEAGKEGQA